MWQTNAIQIRDIPSVDCIRRTLKLLSTRYQNQYSPCMKGQFGWEVFLTTIFLEVVVRLRLGRIHWDASKEESGWADWFGQSSGFSNRSAVCILAGPWEVCRLQLMSLATGCHVELETFSPVTLIVRPASPLDCICHDCGTMATLDIASFIDPSRLPPRDSWLAIAEVTYRPCPFPLLSTQIDCSA